MHTAFLNGQHIKHEQVLLISLRTLYLMILMYMMGKRENDGLSFNGQENVCLRERGGVYDEDRLNRQGDYSTEKSASSGSNIGRCFLAGEPWGTTLSLMETRTRLWMGAASS